MASAAWSVVAPAPPAGAEPVSACTTTSGVIVAVDFSHWGGDVKRGCDTALTTGYDALQVAGFSTAGDEYDGPAFICRIDNEPAPSQDPCVDTPPADATWSYWHANSGQNTWSWSSLGAMSYHPQPGSVDAWAFGNISTPPSFPPSDVRATRPGSPATTVTTRPVTTTSSPATLPPSTPSPTTLPPATGSPTTPSPTTLPLSTRPSTVAQGPAGSTGVPTSGEPAGAPGGRLGVPASKTPDPAKKTGPAASTAGPTAKASSLGAGASTTITVPEWAHPAASSQGRPSSSGRSSLKPKSSGAGGRSTPKVVDVGPLAAGSPDAKGSGGSAVPTLIGVSVGALLVAAGGFTGWRRRQRTN